VGRGILYIKASVAHWKEIRPWRPEFGPEGMHFVSGNSLFFYFLGMNKKQPCLEGREERSAPFGVLMSQKTGARSARARTRGQNPLVILIFF